MSRYVLDLRRGRLPTSVGSKARHLRRLADKGFRVPTTYVCRWEAGERYLGGDLAVLEEVQTELSRLLEPRKAYAVRSSADVEDDVEHSFAGQFRSVLNVVGLPDVLAAVREVWDTAASPAVQSYLARTRPGAANPRMAVIVQEMVRPVTSGVAFSKNPLTGTDEVVVEAVPGLGTALVQKGVTPSRWVHKWGEWIVRQDADGVDQAVVEQVVAQTKAIAKAHGAPVDLEWVYDGADLYWVQMRDITSLDSIPLYSSRLAKEMLPGLVKPLVWSVNVPLVNGAWVKVFTELIGPNDIEAGELAKSFYYRAYFNMGTIGRIFELLGLPRETLELLMGVEAAGPERPRFKPTAKTYRLLPRMLRFALGKLNFGRRAEVFLPRITAAYRSLAADDVAQMSERELLAAVDRLCALTAEAAYYNIVIPLSMQVYNSLLGKQLAKVGVDFANFDLTHGLAEIKELDPATHLGRLHRMYAELPAEAQATIAAGDYADFQSLAGIEPLQREVVGFLARFGHLSDSGNDFTVVPWRENPEVVLKMVANVPKKAGEVVGPKVRYEGLRLSPARRLLVGRLYHRARQFRLLREQISSTYTFGYGLFRCYFLALGDRFVARGLLADREDVFFLSQNEVHAAVADEQAAIPLAVIVAKRRQEMEAAKAITPPGTIYGEEALPVARQVQRLLRGTPTSRGYYRGPARVVCGLADFDRVQEGDVLVIPYSDVGWTPLFAKAGAVVAESGGILSHSSIIAREYGIPAVVSVADACQLADGTIVTVDGYRGEVVVADLEPMAVADEMEANLAT
ncbi:MAG: PEP/pyruvate-binding domain-containing protein [Chloroflexota bacterium]